MNSMLTSSLWNIVAKHYLKRWNTTSGDSILSIGIDPLEFVAQCRRLAKPLRKDGDEPDRTRVTTTFEWVVIQRPYRSQEILHHWIPHQTPDRQRCHRYRFLGAGPALEAGRSHLDPWSTFRSFRLQIFRYCSSAIPTRTERGHGVSH
jgi:hypothetical protein